MNAPGKPVLLLYSHYDVQPVDPLDKWVSAPFDPVIRNGKLFARGVADDKGQLWIMLKAIEAYMKTAGTLPVNIKILFEGEEESDGEHIARYVASKPDWLKDVTSVVVLDGAMFAAGLPTITNGLRGIVCAEVEVTTLSGDRHSGMDGGAAPNANLLVSLPHLNRMTAKSSSRASMTTFLLPIRSNLLRGQRFLSTQRSIKQTSVPLN
jgi:acetylornithine deacetylase/succinyl-diaminopimelate desuccinylase-like protein